MKKFEISRLTRKSVRSLIPYSAKEIPCKAKLDGNESPYVFTPNEFMRKIKDVEVNRYPDPEAKRLKKVVAHDLRIKPDNILVGNGSDEIIYYLIITFGGPVLFPTPTFSMYGIISQALGEKSVGVPLTRKFELDEPEMLNAVQKYSPKLVFLSTPNNPTGNRFSAQAILKIIEASNGIVVVDEAYHPFAGGKGFIPNLKKYKNLAVLRTLSKVGFAGLRTGFLIGSEELIREVNKVRLPYNVNTLSQAIAEEAVKDRQILHAQAKTIIAERIRLYRALSGIKGVTAYPSDANFILFTVQDADGVYERLLKSGVLVRNLSNVIEGALRVTVGSPQENSLFLQALKKAFQNTSLRGDMHEKCIGRKKDKRDKHID